MVTAIAFLAAIITVETALTDGTKTVEKTEVPETDGVVRFVIVAADIGQEVAKHVAVTHDVHIGG